MGATRSRLYLPASLTGTWPECQTHLFAAATGYAAGSDHPEHIFRAVIINSRNRPENRKVHKTQDKNQQVINQSNSASGPKLKTTPFLLCSYPTPKPQEKSWSRQFQQIRHGGQQDKQWYCRYCRRQMPGRAGKPCGQLWRLWNRWMANASIE